MPTYKVTDPTSGKSLKLTGDSPPTEDELIQVFSGVSSNEVEPPQYEPPPQESYPMPWKDVAVGAVKNLPSSAVETGKSMVTPFIHPIETGKTVGRLVLGGAEKLIPGEQGHEENFDQFTTFLKDRYGSVENFKKTLATDPVGVGTDFASLFSGGGAVLKGVGTAGKIERLATAGRLIQETGSAMEPINISKRLLNVPTHLIPQSKIDKVYQSSAKFLPSLDPDTRLLITRTALDNKIMPTSAGLDKTKSLIRDIQEEVTTKIGQADDVGHFMPLDRLFSNFDDLKDTIKRVSSDPMSEVRQYELIEKSIRKANLEINRGLLNPNEVQALKVDIHQKLQKQYEKTMTKPAKIEAQMAVATNARKYLEDIIPEIKELNAKEGALLELNKHLARSANRISNRDIWGIGIPIKAGVGGVIGGASGSAEVSAYAAAAGAVAGLLDTPTVKAQIAIVLNTLKNKGVNVSPTRAAIKLGLFQAGRAEEESID